MEFDWAAKRLAKDHSTLKKKKTAARRTLLSSSHAKHDAAQLKQEQERLLHEKRRLAAHRDYIEQCMRQCERKLGIHSLLVLARNSTTTTSKKTMDHHHHLLLQPTSIHGAGDKIALPPSILQVLTSRTTTAAVGDDSAAAAAVPDGPWTFRIGLLRPNYQFPSSPLLQNLQLPEAEDDELEHDHMDEDDDADNNKRQQEHASAYLDELRHKYLAYTHGTVVEFTQEEGHVGLPQSIAAALLQQAAAADATKLVPIKRTVDPASSISTRVRSAAGDDEMDMEHADDDTDEKTPGHLAWGAFDLPDMAVEVSLIKLPKGKACTLTPTVEAVQNGFYNLQDIKLVLEQSLIRTRATLSLGEVIPSWHRGTKYDLTVTSLTPSSYNAVLCINTDIEVEFGHVELPADLVSADSKKSTVAKEDQPPTGGRVLSGNSVTRPVVASETATNAVAINLLAEPPVEQTEGVCVIQIRADGIHGRRRFDVHKASIKDLLDYTRWLLTSHSSNHNMNNDAMNQQPQSLNANFRLVTRFPRRVFSSENANLTLAEVGITSKQELLLVENT